MWQGAQDGESVLWWGMVDINVQREVSGPRARARVRVWFLESCRGRVLVRLDWVSFSKVMATVQFSHRITVRQGWHPWSWWRVGPQVCTRVRVMSLLKCMRWMGLCLDLGSYSDVWTKASLDFIIKIWHRWHQCWLWPFRLKNLG